MFVCAYMLMNREIYYKALAPGIMEVEKSKPRRSDRVNSDQSLSPINRRVDGGNQVLVQSEGRRQKTAVPTHGQSGRVCKFFLTLPSLVDWIGQPNCPPTGEGNLLSLVYHLDVNVIQKHPQRHTQNNIKPYIRTPDILALCGPVNLSYQINHHNRFISQLLPDSPPHLKMTRPLLD